MHRPHAQRVRRLRFGMLRNMKVDAVISDVVMPEMDGYEFYLHVKQEMPQIPVVLMTAYYYDKDHIIKRSKLKGLEGAIFKKPVNPAKLRQMLIRCGRRATAAADSCRQARPRSLAPFLRPRRSKSASPRLRSETSRAREEASCAAARASRSSSTIPRDSRSSSRTASQADRRNPGALRAVLLSGRDRRRSAMAPASIYSGGWRRQAGIRFMSCEFGDRRIAVVHPRVGAPMGAAVLEMLIALGCRKFIACGGAGVLGSQGRRSAISWCRPRRCATKELRTTTFPPAARSRRIRARSPRSNRCSKRNGHDYLLGKTWTTDALYRETRAKVERRKREGCLTVEMEAAAFFAVAKFRGVEFGQILYARRRPQRRMGSSQLDEASRSASACSTLAAEACLSM